MGLQIPRNSSEQELAAFDRVCERLHGFDESFSFERLDGLLCAVAAGPRALALEDHLDALFDDCFERAFGDPQSRAEALSALSTRLSVLRDQLDPEALFERPDEMRLDPFMAAWTEEERAELVERGELTTEEAAMLRSGVEWMAGFMAAVEALPELWAVPQDEEAQAAFKAAFDQIDAVMMATGSEELQAHLATYYADREAPSHDDLIAEACMSVQDLRLYWVDFAPVTPTRRVEAAPGRNDPCPCGSGKKYKKCHGAT